LQKRNALSAQETKSPGPQTPDPTVAEKSQTRC